MKTIALWALITMIFPFANAEELIIRSKRQSCVCVTVTFPTPDNLNPLGTNFQCSCDTDGRTGIRAATMEKQEDLRMNLEKAQQHLRQAEGKPLCECRANPLYSSLWMSTQSDDPPPSPYGYQAVFPVWGNQQPMFDCFCALSPRANDDSVITTPAPVTSLPQLLNYNLSPGSQGTWYLEPQRGCNCVKVIVSVPQNGYRYDCNCFRPNGGGNAAGVAYQEPSATQGSATTTLTSTPAPAPATFTSTSTSTTTTTATTLVPPNPAYAETDDTSSLSSGINSMVPTNIIQPITTPCVMIRISTGDMTCACQEGFRQCTRHVCCNSDRFRPHESAEKSRRKVAAEAAVKWIVDVLKTVRDNFA